MKSKEELNSLKEQVDTLNKKLAALTEEELALVSGGVDPDMAGSRYEAAHPDFGAPRQEWTLP